MNDLDKVKDKIDVVSLIGEYITLKRAGRNFKARCPFHSEKTASFVVSPERQIWHCFGCGKGGDIFTFFMDYERTDFPEALKFLAEKAGVKLTGPVFKNDSEKKKEIIYAVNHLTASFYNYLLLNHNAGKKALSYLTDKRKITPPIIKTFNLGYAPQGNVLTQYLINKKGYKNEDLVNAGASNYRNGRLTDFFVNRIIFPIYDTRGNIIAFSGRALDESLPKYINTRETQVYKKGDTLFGLNVAKDEIKKENRAIVVEGEFDVISPFKEGVKNVVAIKGTALTLPQIKILKRFAEKITFCFDSDKAGIAAQIRSIEIIEQEKVSASVIVLPEGKDLDELIKENPALFKKTIKNDVNIYDFLIDSVLNDYNPKTAEGKKKILEKTLPFLTLIENEVVKEHYFKKLALLLETSLESLTKQAEKIKQGGAREATVEVRKTLIRQETIEPYLLSLIFQSKDPKKSFQESYEIIKDNPFSQIALGKIYKIFADYVSSNIQFDIKSFLKVLPQELFETFDKSYLSPIPEFDEEKLTSEIKKIAIEIKDLSIKKRIKNIGEEITLKEKGDKNEEEIGKLKKEFNRITSFLASDKA